MKTSKNWIVAGIATVSFGAVPLQAATITWTGLGGDGLYKTAANWSTNSVPDTANGDTAIISTDAVVYQAGPDLTIANGGVLRINSGSWTQTTSNSYIQLNGGSVIVAGGTFNQGTASSTPFNVAGTGNVFSITSGVANFTQSVNVNSNLTFTIAGGTVNLGAGTEFDFNSTTTSMSGGVLNARLITGVNSGGANAVFTLSGGTVNLTDGIYGGGGNVYVNFTTGSNGVITFANNSTTDVMNMLNAGVIKFNDTVDSSQFTVTSLGGNASSLSLTAVPEPSTYALLGAGLLGLVVLRRRAKVAA